MNAISPAVLNFIFLLPTILFIIINYCLAGLWRSWPGFSLVARFDLLNNLEYTIQLIVFTISGLRVYLLFIQVKSKPTK